jgi:hypothetical protein
MIGRLFGRWDSEPRLVSIKCCRHN